MKKIIKILVALVLFSPFLGYANVDETNVFDFKYECSESGVGRLKTVFKLGGHHDYVRFYTINQPGIIEIADAKHSTVLKSANISIPGCDFKPTNCNIDNYGTWQKENEKDREIINISDYDSVDSNTNKYTFAKDGMIEFSIGTENFESQDKLEIALESDGLYVYSFEDDEKNEIFHKSLLIKQISGQDNFFLQQEENNLILKESIFSRENSGVVKSSTNEFDIFEANGGHNSNNRGDSCATPTSYDKNTRGIAGKPYCTGLNYWDYNQHHYTTTKVKLYPVSVTCKEIEKSDGTSQKLSTSYTESTVGNITAPKFSGGMINGQAVHPDNGLIVFTTNALNVKNLMYERVGKVGTKKLGVKSIKLSIKQNDITLSEKQISNFSSEFNRVGFFPPVNGITLEKDGKIITQTPGDYQIVFAFFDSNGQQLGTYTIPLLILVNNDYKASNPILSSNNVFANGYEGIQVCYYITDSFGNKLPDGKSNIKYTPKSGNAIKSEDTTFINSKLCLNLKSVLPQKINTFSMVLEIPEHKLALGYPFSGRYKKISTTIPGTLDFKKPISGSFEVQDKLSKSWDEVPDIRKASQKYKLKLENIGNLRDYSNGRVSITKGNTIKISDGFTFKTFSDIVRSFGNNIRNYLGFTARIKTSSPDSVLEKPEIFAKNLQISYRVKGKNVSYNLDDFSIEGCKRTTLGVKIIGILQGDGKSAITTSEGENYTDLTKSELRAEIRKNATVLTRNMKHGQIVNGIKYVEGGTYELETNPNYETLIVKNGNVYIGNNVTKSVGIIVLKDNYNVSRKETIGNIYIGDSVTKIDAFIYSDGALISADKNGNKYSDDRLGNKLELHGSLFTRNTIGGAVSAGSEYKLPGGKNTTDITQVERYDLNYLRKVKSSCSAGGIDDNYSFLIKYNPAIQTNPPKGFGN